MQLMNIGFGNMISADRLLAVVSPCCSLPYQKAGAGGKGNIACSSTPAVAEKQNLYLLWIPTM